MQGNSKAAAAKKKSAAAGEPSDAPRRDHRWDGEHELVESAGLSHFVGVWVLGVLDAGDEREDCEPAPKKENAHQSFQKTSWLALLPWHCVAADDSAAACSHAGVRCTVPRLRRLLQGALLAVCRARRDRANTQAATISTTAAAVVSGLLPCETTATSTTVAISDRTQPDLLKREDLADDRRPQGGNNWHHNTRLLPCQE